MNKILGIGIVVGSLFLWAKGKAEEISGNFISAIDQVNYKIDNIKNVKWTGGLPFGGNTPKLKFDLDLKLINPTNTNFILEQQNAIRLSRIEFLDKNAQIMAVSQPNINSINLPANGTALFKNIPTEIPVNKIDNVIQQFSSINPNDLNLRVSVIVAGKEFTLK